MKWYNFINKSFVDDVGCQGCLFFLHKGSFVLSLVSHGSATGKRTKRVLAFDARSKYCRTCIIAKRFQNDPRPHKKRKNGEAVQMQWKETWLSVCLRL